MLVTDEEKARYEDELKKAKQERKKLLITSLIPLSLFALITIVGGFAYIFNGFRIGPNMVQIYMVVSAMVCGSFGVAMAGGFVVRLILLNRRIKDRNARLEIAITERLLLEIQEYREKQP